MYDIKQEIIATIIAVELLTSTPSLAALQVENLISSTNTAQEVNEHETLKPDQTYCSYKEMEDADKVDMLITLGDKCSTLDLTLYKANKEITEGILRFRRAPKLR